jgi:hypothetical protein
MQLFVFPSINFHFFFDSVDRRNPHFVALLEVPNAWMALGFLRRPAALVVDFWGPN